MKCTSLLEYSILAVAGIAILVKAESPLQDLLSSKAVNWIYHAI